MRSMCLNKMDNNIPVVCRVYTPIISKKNEKVQIVSYGKNCLKKEPNLEEVFLKKAFISLVSSGS